MTPPLHSRGDAQAVAFDPAHALARHAVALGVCLPLPMTEGNRLTLLSGGLATYRAMFEAIDAARDHINLESGMFATEGPGKALARRLMRKRREGVKVNLLYDAAGGVAQSRYLDALRKAGVRMCCYEAPVGWQASLHWGRQPRDRRELLIVDGRVAFAGGVHTHVRLHGPAVAQLQQLFIDHWVVQAGQRPLLSHFFPRVPATGGTRAGIAAHEAGVRRSPPCDSLLRAIDLAQTRICITAGRFMPPRRLVRSLVGAAHRGVAVQLLLPGAASAWAALPAARSHYAPLLRAGARIHERADASPRANTAVIDGLWSTVGSAGLDHRSLLHDAGVNVVALDPRFGAQLEAAFAHDLRSSTEVTASLWRRRGPLQRLGESVARRFEYFV